MKTPSPPAVSLAPDDARQGALLTEALVHVAVAQARERRVSDTVVVAALVSALGSVAVSVARANGWDLMDFEAFVANHFSYVFARESRRRLYH